MAWVESLWARSPCRQMFYSGVLLAERARGGQTKIKLFRVLFKDLLNF